MYICLAQFNYANVPMFSMFSYVYTCLFMLIPVYSCVPIINYVYQWLIMFIYGYCVSLLATVHV